MSKNTTARLAGFIYLLVVITGIFHLLYVPSQLIQWDDPISTINNIKSSELLFRAGIVVGVVSFVFYLILPFILFELFKEVNKTMAQLMLILAVVSVPISLYNMVAKINILSLLSDAEYLKTLTAEYIQAQVMLLLKSYNNGIAVVKIFWGLWLFPFGYLAYKSAHIPRVLGVSLMLGCLGYLISFSTRLLFPEVSIPGFVSWPASFGEIGSCFWLLIMGVKTNSLQPQKPTQNN
jgi:hypothetical protein